MPTLLLLAMSAAPALVTIDGQPVPDAEVELYLTAYAHGLLPPAWPSTPRDVAEQLPEGRALIEPLIEQHLAARAAKGKVTLGKEDLARLPKIDPKGDDYSYFVSGAPKGVPRTAAHLEMIRRAMLVEQWVKTQVKSGAPTEEDFAAVLAAKPELATEPAAMQLSCIPPPREAKQRAQIRALVAQGKTLDEIGKEIGDARRVGYRHQETDGSPEEFERLRRSPDGGAVSMELGATCARVSQTAARPRSPAEQRSAAEALANDRAEARAWHQLFEPLLQKAKIAVDEARVNALLERIQNAPR